MKRASPPKPLPRLIKVENQRAFSAALKASHSLQNTNGVRLCGGGLCHHDWRFFLEGFGWDPRDLLFVATAFPAPFEPLVALFSPCPPSTAGSLPRRAPTPRAAPAGAITGATAVLPVAVELVASIVFAPSALCRLCRFNAAVCPFSAVSFAAGSEPGFGEGAAWLGKENPIAPHRSAAANNPRA